MLVSVNSIGDWDGLKSLNENISHYSFDFWNTIAKSNIIFKNKRADLLIKKLDLKLTRDEINKVFNCEGEAYNKLIENGGKSILTVDLYRKVISNLDIDLDIDISILINEIYSIFIENPPIIDDDFLFFFKSLDRSNIKISVTSNTTYIPGFLIKEFLILSNIHFDFYLFSDEFGFGKPSDNIFKELIFKARKLHPNISTNEIIHIGDNYKADYLGAQNSSIKAYQIKDCEPLTYPKYAVHSITDKLNLPLIAEDYSRFKFGDISIANKYGNELFKYFITDHLNWFVENNEDIVIYSSPYSTVPTSSYFLSKVFYGLLYNYIIEKPELRINLKWGKINRLHTYTEDYGTLSAKERFELIKNDTYNFDDLPLKNDRLIFIDDISITGSHQKVIENILVKNNFQNKILFIYYAKLDNTSINPNFENELNYNFVSSIDKLIDIINSGSFKITTRSLKYILKSKQHNFSEFLNSLVIYNKLELIKELYLYSLNNEYDKIVDFSENFSILKSFLTTLR